MTAAGTLTPKQLAKEEGVQAAQDGCQRLLLQQRHMAAGCCTGCREQRPLYALQHIVHKVVTRCMDRTGTASSMLCLGKR